jgi:hypothetical protein
VLPVGTIAAFSLPASRASRISFLVLSQSRTFRGLTYRSLAGATFEDGRGRAWLAHSLLAGSAAAKLAREDKKRRRDLEVFIEATPFEVRA